MNKFSLTAASYAKPTPAKWRKIGDSLLIISTFLLVYIPDPTTKIIAGVLGVASKIITNFFHEETPITP